LNWVLPIVADASSAGTQSSKQQAGIVNTSKSTSSKEDRSSKCETFTSETHSVKVPIPYRLFTLFVMPALFTLIILSNRL